MITKKTLVCWLCIFVIVVSSLANAQDQCKYYPHWDCHDAKQAEIINKIEDFIVWHHPPEIVAFDFEVVR
jgi:hypothetical protein